MGSHHRYQKRARSGQRASTYRSGKNENGFAGLDPAKMGLDGPAWLTESSPACSRQRAPQPDEAISIDEPLQPRTFLEGLKVVCICKGIKTLMFWKAMDAGAETREEINRATGSGSGGCKGRRCGPRILEMLRNRSL
jgi:bacterioferritin-associated ferredoxin